MKKYDQHRRQQPHRHDGDCKYSMGDLIHWLTKLVKQLFESANDGVRRGRIGVSITVEDEENEMARVLLQEFNTFHSDQQLVIKGRLFKKDEQSGETVEVFGVPVTMESDKPEEIPLTPDPKGRDNVMIAKTPGTTGFANILMSAPGYDTSVQPVRFSEAPARGQIAAEITVEDDPDAV